MDIFSAMFTGIAVWANPAPPPVAHEIQVATVETVPNYANTALNEADVGLYLQVMRSAATAGGSDETVAEQQGVRPRYDAIKVVVVSELTAGNNVCAGTSCSQSALAVHDADQDVLMPHAAEIQALQKQVGGSKSGQ